MTVIPLPLSVVISYGPLAIDDVDEGVPETMRLIVRRNNLPQLDFNGISQLVGHFGVANESRQTIAWLGAAMTSVPDATPFPKLAVELH